MTSPSPPPHGMEIPNYTIGSLQLHKVPCINSSIHAKSLGEQQHTSYTFMCLSITGRSEFSRNIQNRQCVPVVNYRLPITSTSSPTKTTSFIRSPSNDGLPLSYTNNNNNYTVSKSLKC